MGKEKSPVGLIQGQWLTGQATIGGAEHDSTIVRNDARHQPIRVAKSRGFEDAVTLEMQVVGGAGSSKRRIRVLPEYEGPSSTPSKRCHDSLSSVT